MLPTHTEQLHMEDWLKSAILDPKNILIFKWTQQNWFTLFTAPHHKRLTHSGWLNYEDLCYESLLQALHLLLLTMSDKQSSYTICITSIWRFSKHKLPTRITPPYLFFSLRSVIVCSNIIVLLWRNSDLNWNPRWGSSKQNFFEVWLMMPGIYKK